MKLNVRRFDVLLAEKCLSIAGICDKSEISKATLAKLRNGHTARPCTIGKLAKALDVEVTELIIN
jgi:putative transcriptional regulator